MKKQNVLEIITVLFYAFGITPYLIILAEVVNIYWSFALLSITLLGYYKFIKWVEEVF